MGRLPLYHLRRLGDEGSGDHADGIDLFESSVHHNRCRWGLPGVEQGTREQLYAPGGH
jgi:hypothetical protein